MGYFFVPVLLGGVTIVLKDVLDTLILLEAFKRIFVSGPKIDFFPRGYSRVFGQK